MTNLQIVLEYMQKTGSLTVKEAEEELHIGNLRRIIKVMKRKGFDIVSKWCPPTSGNYKKFKRYKIAGKSKLLDRLKGYH